MKDESELNEGEKNEAPEFTEPLPVEVSPDPVPNDGEERVVTDEEQVASLEQTPAEELAVDPDVEQPSQEPTDVVESDSGAEDTD